MLCVRIYGYISYLLALFSLQIIMRIKSKKYSQNYLTDKLDWANIYANEINKIFVYDRRKQNVYRRKRTG